LKGVETMKKIVVAVFLSLFIVSTLFAASASLQNRNKDCGEYCPVCGSPGIPQGITLETIILTEEVSHHDHLMKEIFVCEHGHIWYCFLKTY